MALSVLIGALLIYLMAMFLFGELGLIKSYDKTVKISRLRLSIQRLERIYRNKRAILLRVRRNPSLAVRYEPWRGYTGAVSGTRRFSRPFFVRHPLLIVVLAAIIATTACYILHQKKRNSLSSEEKEKRKPLRSNSYIKPSWG